MIKTHIILNRYRLSYSDYIWIFVSLWIDCLVETRNYSMPSLAVVASSFKVTDGGELIIRIKTVWPTIFLLNVFTAL